MIISTGLASVPFLGSTDSTRLQMAAKQLPQVLTHPNNERPYVIGKNWDYLTETTKYFRRNAEHPGSVVYENDDLMIVVFHDEEKNEDFMETLQTPKILQTANAYGTKLNYKHPVGNFEKGDVLYEYDAFKGEMPSYGYNVNTMFFPFFGLNFEDAIVISESFANKARATKVEKFVIPIYTYSLFKMNYPDSKYGFIPEPGQQIDNKSIIYECSPRNSNNKKQTLQAMSVTDFSKLVEDNFQFTSQPILSKLRNGVINNFKVHKVSKKHSLIDKNLEDKVETLLQDYRNDINQTYQDLINSVGEKYAKQLMASNYIMTDAKSMNIKTEDLVYVIEVEISSDKPTDVGDKEFVAVKSR